MDLGPDKGDKPNPRENANFFSILTFWYTWPIFVKGRKREMQVSDLYKTLSSQESKLLGDKIEKIWRNEELKALNLNKKPSITKVLFKMFGAEFVGHAIIGLFGDVGSVLLQPVILGELMDYYIPGQVTKTKTNAYCLALALILCISFYVQVTAPNNLGYMQVGMKMRVACCSLVYRKAIRLSKTALGQTTVGQIVNLVSNDVARFDTFTYMAHYIWTAPLQTLIGSFIMYQEVGFSAVAGVAAILLFIPVQSGVAKMTAKFRSQSTQKTDERVRLMNEIISGIQVVKMYAWEKPFAKLVSVIRRNELKFIRATSCPRAVVFSYIPFSGQLCLFISILSCITFNQSITPRKVFVLVSFFNVLRKSMCGSFTYATAEIAELSVSLKRLNNFLILNEKSAVPIKQIAPFRYSVQQETAAKSGSISIENGNAKWNELSTDYIFKNLNINVKPGSVVAIIGPVGSGKSAILQLLLKELPLAEGDLEVYGDISYASQEPWVFNGTVRQNILFNKPYSEKRYESVINKCSLTRDLQLFTRADMTFVGERGVTLSGGQRARISLARAIYREADIYLLDDPLSAVDTHVARELFQECIRGFLRGKTVILVTHQVQFLKDVDNIIIIENGTIKAQGTFDELQQSGLEFAKMFKTEELKEERLLIKDYRTNGCGAHHLMTYSNEEQRTLGIVSKDVYKTYICGRSNWFYTLVTLMAFVTSQVGVSFGDVFISHCFWDFSHATYIHVYAGILLATITLTIFSNLAFNILCLRSSRKLHYNMFNSILKGTMRFFNLNSTGRILNRFSKDMGAIDDALPNLMLSSIQFVLLFLGIIVVISSANPWFLIPTFILFVLFYCFSSLYLMTSRNVKRLEGVTIHFTATSNADVGLVVTQAIGLIGFIQWATRQCVDTENQMISVERVLEYNHIEHEQSAKSEENKKLPQSWPQNGEIRFVNVDLHYSSTDFPVLKGLSFTIKPLEKVGIVGRTGAGKSSLINALFQLSDTSGSILIDCVDIKGLELEHLRSKISIIPQEPVLFSGTVRRNLDPFGAYTDELLWKSLENVELIGVIKELDLGLDSHVSEGGSNFSVGQRQLICLARAILRNNKILVLDEATANVDPHTDALIQKTIREKFAQCTVLTIAHRLNTVIDSDKILVLNDGCMIEFGNPYSLLQNTSGVFYGMVLQTGSAMANTLFKIAEENFNKITDAEAELHHNSCTNL
ncbi:hypothetical protein RI129_005347 [Pyrocoelia pectoralis]|uniref:Uncharacterized protein n=1 Tax=Pyrocoelia pectoralis TaxID=417401 RepID=A0AAN7ZS80_9COLE